MASIKFGALVVGIAGKVGGTVFRRGANGPVMSNIPLPGGGFSNNWVCIDIPVFGRVCNNGCITVWETYPGSSHTCWIGHKLYGMRPNNSPPPSQVWATLTDAERLAWQTAAASFPATNRFGDVYTPSGYQVYLKLNSMLGQIGAELIANPPLPPVITPPDDIHFAIFDTSVLNLTLGAAIPSGQYLEVCASAPISKGSSSPRGGYKRLFFGSALGSTAMDLSDYYITRFGNIPANSRVGIKYRMINRATGVSNAWSNILGNVQEGLAFTASISVTVNKVMGVFTAHVATNSTGALSLELFKATPVPNATVITSVASPTENTPQVTDVVISANTTFALRITLSDGSFKDIVTIASLP